MRKRVSLRRWKKRCALGREIPAYAIIGHRLTRWFAFTPASKNRDTHLALIPRGYVTEWEWIKT
jgi:hypothetical protein